MDMSWNNAKKEKNKKRREEEKKRRGKKNKEKISIKETKNNREYIEGKRGFIEKETKSD